MIKMGDILNEKQAIKRRNQISKIITTVFVFYAHFSYGFLALMVGTSISDIEAILNTTSVDLYFTIFPIGYTLGAFCGLLYNYVNRKLVTFVLLSAMGICLSMIPHASSLIMLLICGGLIGFGMGGWDCAVTPWLVEVWNDKVGPALQGCSMFYSIGTILGPLVVQPFITGKIHVEKPVPTNTSIITTTESKSTTTAASLSLLNTTSLTSSTTSVFIEKLINRRAKLTIPFSISSGVIILSGILILSLLFFSKSKGPKTTKRLSVGSFLVDKNRTIPLIFGWKAHLITFLSALLIGSYFSIEVIYLQLFTKFGQNTVMHLPSSKSAIILSALTAAQTFGRFISIFTLIKLKPNIMLMINFVTISCGLFVVVFFQTLTGMWIGNIIIGLGMGSTSPGLYAFIKQYISITNIKGTIFVSSAGITQAVLPIIVNMFIETNPMILIYTNFMLMTITVLAFILIQLTAKN